MRPLSRSTVALCLLLASVGFAQSRSEEEAGDVSEVDKDAAGPLRERIRPVSGHLFLMKRRFEVSPGLALSFRDAFFSKLIFGGALTYHFSEDFALSVKAGYGVSLVSNAAQVCTLATDTSSGGCAPPTMEQLTRSAGVPQNKAYGLINLLASVDLQWSPIYGKLSLVAEKFLHFNMYALAGPALVSYGPSGTLTAGGNVGVGFRFFINRYLTLRTELRDTIYQEQGYPVGYTSLRNQLMFDVGVSLFLPMEFEEGR
jgi:outer membrane beta-barrel protein